MTFKHPGQIIREEILLPRNLSIAETARLLGVTRSNLSNLVNGKISLTPNMAKKFEQSFNIDSQRLLDAQQKCDAVTLHASTNTVALQYVPQLFHVRAKDIENLFSQSIDMRAELAVMMRLLIHSVSVAITKIDFPGFDNSERPGWDGWVEQTSANPWIPMGKSGWEFGVTEKIKSKADHDYEKSIKKNSPLSRKEITFVFVTPRHWPGKEKWVQQKRQENHWKDVRAYDSSDLEQWVEQSLIGQVWLSEKIGSPISGVKSLDACWRSWCDVTVPPFPARMFEVPVHQCEKELIDFLNDSNRHQLYLKADSAEEALAFLYQAFSVIDELRKERGNVLVLEKKEPIAKIMLSGKTNGVFVITDREVEREFAKYSQQVKSIIWYPSNFPLVNDDVLELQPLAWEDFKDALKKELTISEDQVNRYCAESGGSLTVLRRRMSTLPAIRCPHWASDKVFAESLIPMVLIGVWDAGNKYDQDALISLSGCTTDQVEKQINDLLMLEDTPLWSLCNPMQSREKVIQGVISKVDALLAVSPYVTRSVLTKFFDLAKKVLTKTNPIFEVSADDKSLLSVEESKHFYSDELRRSVAETVVLIAIHGKQLFDRRLGINSQALADKLIESLVCPLTAKTLDTNNDVLATYAEASPDVLLLSLEATRDENFEELKYVLRPGSTNPFGVYCPRQGLLDALTILAWNPKLFPRVVDVLGSLAEVEISDNWGNTPIALLCGLFRSWFPQTKADLISRQRAFSCLFSKHRKVGWNVAIRQLRVSNQWSARCHIKPKWRVDALGCDPLVSPAESREFVEFVIQHIFSNDLSTDEIIDILGRIKALTSDQQNIFWGKVNDWISRDPSDEDVARLKEEIRLKLKQSDISPHGREVIGHLIPKDPICQYGWLFQHNWVESSVEERPVCDYKVRDRQIEKKRIAALREIVNLLGIEGVYDLVKKGDCQLLIGLLLVKGKVLKGNQQINLIKQTLILNGYKDLLSGMLEELLNIGQLDSILDELKKDLSEKDMLELFLLSPYDKRVWKSLKFYPLDFQKQYWEQVKPRIWVNSDSVNESTQYLLEVRRPVPAFKTASLSFQFMSPNLMYRLLKMMLLLAPKEIKTLDRYDVRKAFAVLDSESGLKIEKKALLELSYVRYLADCTEQRGNQIPNIEKLIEQTPQFFIDLVKKLNSEDGVPDFVDGIPITSSNVHWLILNIKNLPFQNETNLKSRKAKFGSWVQTVRHLAKDQGCLDAVDYYLGDYLAKSTVGADGIWPEESVRNVLEMNYSSNMVRGCFFRKLNLRGVVMRKGGGDPERQLSVQFRNWSEKLAENGEFVTADLLSSLASFYENEAKSFDEEYTLRNRLTYSL